MVRIAAYVFGLLLIVSGILGLIFIYNPTPPLQEYFCFNAAHNITHIATGIIALVVGSLSTYASRIFFRIIGILYVFVAVVGFFFGATPLTFGIITDHPAEIILHGGFAALSLYLGFFVGSRETS